MIVPTRQFIARQYQRLPGFGKDPRRTISTQRLVEASLQLTRWSPRVAKPLETARRRGYLTGPETRAPSKRKCESRRGNIKCRIADAMMWSEARRWSLVCQR